MSKYTLSQLRGAFGAGFHTAERNATLAGKYIHTIDRYGDIERQGKVLSEQASGTFLVQWFSWLDGEPTTAELCSIDSMEEWVFYAAADEWRQVGDKYICSVLRVQP